MQHPDVSCAVLRPLGRCSAVHRIVSPAEKDLQVSQGPKQPESLGRGAKGDQSAGGHGSDLTAAG